MSTGWLLNFAWALSTFDHRSEERQTVAVAARYGWACPTALIAAASVVQYLIGRTIF